MDKNAIVMANKMKAIAIISDTTEPNGTRRVSFLDAKTKTPLSHAFLTDDYIAEHFPTAEGVPTNAKNP